MISDLGNILPSLKGGQSHVTWIACRSISLVVIDVLSLHRWPLDLVELKPLIQGFLHETTLATQTSLQTIHEIASNYPRNSYCDKNSILVFHRR